MEPSKFNELTKAFATTTTRREALWRIGGILGGTALAGLFPGLALASNKTCAQFCESVFGMNTPAEEQCVADATHHKGLCYTCGPASPGGTKPICCPQNPDGTCTSYSSATCCGSGQTCTNGACVATCPAGEVLLANGTCAEPCFSPGAYFYFCVSCCRNCDADIDSTNNFCSNNIGSGAPCQSDANCPHGEFCVAGAPGQNGVCLTATVCSPPCSPPCPCI